MLSRALLYDQWLATLGPALADHIEHHMNIPLMLGSSVFALGGVGLAWWMYVRQPGTADKVEEALPGAYDLSRNKFYLDELYYAFVVAPLTVLSVVEPGFRPVRRRWAVVDLFGQVPAGAGGAVPAGAEWARAVLCAVHGAGVDGVFGGTVAAVTGRACRACRFRARWQCWKRARNGKPARAGGNTVDDATLIDGLLKSFPLLVPEWCWAWPPASSSSALPCGRTGTCGRPWPSVRLLPAGLSLGLTSSPMR